jgi:hypothetical protein
LKRGSAQANLPLWHMVMKLFTKRLPRSVKAGYCRKLHLVYGKIYPNYQKFYFEKTENSEVKFRGLKKVIDAMEIGNTNTAVKTMETILEYGDQEFIARVYYSKSEGGDSMANY